MIPGTNKSCFQNVSQASVKDYSVLEVEDHIVSSGQASNNSLLYSVSFLKEKVHQLQSLVTTILVSPDPSKFNSDIQHVPVTQPESTSLAMANMSSLVQEIILTASSLMVTCNSYTNEILQHQQQHVDPNNQERSSSGQGFYFSEAFDDHTWYGDCDANVISNNNNAIRVSEKREILLSETCDDIIELDAADLLAKYTHYCQVCGKGFKRDANLRMHMRAHGDEYKTSAALTNPLKNNGSSIGIKVTRKLYSCPHEGCRWNKKHAKFQPLKSMICVKNHYKRSHCPKMYVCKRCNRKQFSVLSDLRTHEKHCGDLKWLCSCGTTFSRKDKLMGHVALFVGHTPAINVNTSTKTGKLGHHVTPIQLDER